VANGFCTPEPGGRTPTALAAATTTGGGAAAFVLAAMLAVPAALLALSSTSLSESEKAPSIKSPSMLAIFGPVCFSFLCRGWVVIVG